LQQKVLWLHVAVLWLQSTAQLTTVAVDPHIKQPVALAEKAVDVVDDEMSPAGLLLSMKVLKSWLPRSSWAAESISAMFSARSAGC
jgi:hypothetical protein